MKEVEIIHYNEYKHKKTGGIYVEMDKCIIKLPSGDIQGVIYALPTMEQVFVRTQREFDQKFELHRERTAGGF